MVAISLSGSGEGPGKATTRGYSTAGFRASAQVAIASVIGAYVNSSVLSADFRIRGRQPPDLGQRLYPIG